MKKHRVVLFTLVRWAVAPVRAAGDAADISRLLADYDAAFNAKSMDRPVAGVQ